MQPRSAMATTEVTFILPTINRRDYVVRAVESCLACRSEYVSPRVLVIDGMSDDGAYELLVATYANNPLVRIVQHERVGFQRTAYYGASLVETPYATYMYNDDVITPHFKDLIQKMVETRRSFAMGYGKMFNIERIYPFQALSRFQEYPRFELALAYFGYARNVNYWNLPVSPICCVIATDLLKKWIEFTQEFAQGIPIRQFYMIDRNIGPDLIIYLYGILSHPDSALVAEHVIGQFSEHSESMSIGYGRSRLETGYWFGKLWGFHEMSRQGNEAAAAKAAAYLLVAGYKNLLRMPFTPDRRWFWSYWRELFKVKASVVRYSLAVAVACGIVATAANRLRPHRIPTPL